jgi:hypothetical protein
LPYCWVGAIAATRFYTEPEPNQNVYFDLKTQFGRLVTDVHYFKGTPFLFPEATAYQ